MQKYKTGGAFTEKEILSRIIREKFESDAGVESSYSEASKTPISWSYQSSLFGRLKYKLQQSSFPLDKSIELPILLKNLGLNDLHMQLLKYIENFKNQKELTSEEKSITVRTFIKDYSQQFLASVNWRNFTREDVHWALKSLEHYLFQEIYEYAFQHSEEEKLKNISFQTQIKKLQWISLELLTGS
jgi:hypothetical protein